jgi:hypothetical protein
MQPLDDRDEFPWMEDLEVAPRIYQSKEDYEANMAFDEMRDNSQVY